MPVVAAVVSPHPPLLVPEMAVRAADELDELRAACAAALDRMWAARPDALVVVGSGLSTREYDSSAIGTFAGFGEPLTVPLGGGPTGGAPRDRLPLSLTVGAWLLRDRPPAPPRRGWSIAASASPAECARLGCALAGISARVGLLVMGDGSACNGPKSAGYEDPRAPAFDATVTSALGKGDVAALLDLDPAVAGELLAAGRPAWQVLAGAMNGARAQVRCDAVPYGVRHTVAMWEPA